jgi:hypothetical protein
MPLSYLPLMAKEHQTEELKLEQLRREVEEQRRASTAPDEDESAAHERRAEKARYLRQKLEERAKSERERG